MHADNCKCGALSISLHVAALCNLAIGGKEALQTLLRNLYAPAPSPHSFLETLLSVEEQLYPQFVEMVPPPAALPQLETISHRALAGHQRSRVAAPHMLLPHPVCLPGVPVRCAPRFRVAILTQVYTHALPRDASFVHRQQHTAPRAAPPPALRVLRP